MSFRRFAGRAALLVAVVGLAGVGTTACKASIKIGKKPEPEPEPPPPPPPPPPKPEPPPKMQAVPEKVELPGPIRFKVGTAQLETSSDEPLNVVLEYMKATPEITKLRVEGHTDTDDTNARNMDLSKRRAMAASKWLIAKGIDCKRLVVVGFGEEKLVADPEATADDKAKNRRVDFIPAEKNGKAIANRPVDGGEPGQSAGDPCK